MEQEKKECYDLWMTCFGDSVEYSDFYFKEKTNQNIVLIERVNNHVVSMLHLNPYHVKVMKLHYFLHYIVGVATHPDFRKRGKMRKLLSEGFHKMYHNYEPFTYLSPASDKIYRPFGFTEMYKQHRITCQLKDQVYYDEVLETKCIEYNNCFSELRENMIFFANEKLSLHFDVYVVRNENYFDQWQKEMQAAGGNLLVFTYEGRVIGSLAYMFENHKVEVIEVIACNLFQNEILMAFHKYLVRKYRESEIQSLYFHETHFIKDGIHKNFTVVQEEEKLYLMGRLINVQQFFQMIPHRFHIIKDSKIIQITDPHIEKNNGLFTCRKNPDREYGYELNHIHQRDINSRESVRKLSVEELQKEVFRQLHFYINDVV